MNAGYVIRGGESKVAKNEDLYTESWVPKLFFRNHYSTDLYQLKSTDTNASLRGILHLLQSNSCILLYR